VAKRLLDDGIFSSPSLAECSPRAQDAWPRFLLLADDFGCLDVNPRVLTGRGWPLRPDVSDADVAGWMDEYARAGMLGFWSEGGRVYGFFCGWFGDKGQHKRAEYHPDTNKKGSKRKTPPPPTDLARNLPDLLSRQFPARETTASRENSRREIPVSAYAGAGVIAGAVPGAGAVGVPPPPSVAKPPAPGRTTSTDGEDEGDGLSLQDRMDEVFSAARGRPHEWPPDPYPVLRAIGNKSEDEAEVLRRLTNALTYTRFPRYAQPSDLVQHWARYAEPEAQPATQRRGASATAADKDWSKPVETYVDEHGNERLA
jgi:hypothetical protein